MNEETTRILLVEDDLHLGKLTADTLDVMGLGEIEHVLDARSAITAIKDEAYGLCILDVRLRDGICTDVVHAANQKDLPVILTSGLDDLDLLDVQPNRSHFLRKPVPLDQWEPAIRNLVRSAD